MRFLLKVEINMETPLDSRKLNYSTLVNFSKKSRVLIVNYLI